MTNKLTTVKLWLEALREQALFKVADISLQDSTVWFYRDGAIRHQSGNFFSVIGLEIPNLKGQSAEVVLLDQREIGILGFLLRTQNGVKELLVQAKIEPGNVGIIQLAPTTQATASNAKQVHGGSKPLYLEYFPKESPNIIYDCRQSEQGTRFFEKQNRNVLVENNAVLQITPNHRWLKVEDLLAFCGENYLVNTDARSVLTCAPWEKILGRPPFTKEKKGFGVELRKSFLTPSQLVDLPQMIKKINKWRCEEFKFKIVDLKKFQAWRLDENGVRPLERKNYRVKQIKVQTLGREVRSWDQPMVESFSPGKVVLASGRFQGILHFLFQARREIGLSNRIELTPTVVIEPGEKSSGTPFIIPRAKTRAACFQSEEGGRFYRDRNLFQILDVKDVFSVPDKYFWLTLNDLRRLLDVEGYLTNEARSALSLLLPWL